MVKKLTGAAWLLTGALAAGPATADTLFGVYAGAGTWQQSFSGDVAAGGEAVDLQDDLDFDRDNGNVFYGALEHGIPVLPNIRVNYAEIEGSGANLLSRSIVFDGQVFTVSEDVASEVALTQADAVLYYQVLDGVVSLDLGMAARWVEGDIQITTDSEFARAEFKGVLPMLYARTRVDLPLTGLWLGAEATGLTYDDHQLIDASAQVGWESPYGIGAELGWRTMALELGEVDEVDSAEIDISGPYAALNYHF